MKFPIENLFDTPTMIVGIPVMNKAVRNRFAPAPTGLMHLGNVRAALMNYLFVHQNKGTFIIRIEDTDQQRNFDPGAKQILADLSWLGLTYEEGPGKGGPHAPYFQSERTPLYQEKLDYLINKTDLVYRCFCTSEELEKKRERQIALKLPPRYDRTCLKLSPSAIEQKINEKIPFIWRLKLPQEGSVEINDLARGTVRFEFKNFSDHPLTRQDGSITFLFANSIDDIEMQMTHVFRGEDHLTNTAIQSVIYKAFNYPLPIYWHMPILCNTQGKKLSKRDFGFSLSDLRQAGYLPEAICNYLAIIGGGTFTKEIMTMKELIQNINFAHISPASQIKYDVEKLTWLNYKWLEQMSPAQRAELCLPFIKERYPAFDLPQDALIALLDVIKLDIKTLQDAPTALHFYFVPPEISHAILAQTIESATLASLATIVELSLPLIQDPETFMKAIKAEAKQQEVPAKSLFAFLRLALMGQAEGPSINDLITMLGIEQARLRISQAIAASR